MRAHRLVLVVLAMAVAGAAPSTAAAKLEFNLPAHVIQETDDSAAIPIIDPGRCEAAVFLEFHTIPHAKGYRVVVDRSDHQRLTFLLSPPLGGGGPWVAKYPPPSKQFARFWLGIAYSTGEGCAAAILATRNSAKIISSKVSLDRAYERRFRKVDDPSNWECAYLPGARTVSMKPLGGFFSDPRYIVVKRGGHVTTSEQGSNQPVNLMNNRYAKAGTIIKTGPNSIVKIGALHGGSVLIGSNTTVRLTRGGFEILKQPKHPQFRVRHNPGQDFKVRTCSAVHAARG